MSQLHGYPTRGKMSEETTDTDTSSNCNFAVEISKLCNELVGNFHDLRNEIFSVNNKSQKETTTRIYFLARSFMNHCLHFQAIMNTTKWQSS